MLEILSGWLELTLIALMWIVLHPATYWVTVGLTVGWHGHEVWERTRLYRQVHRTPAPREES